MNVCPRCGASNPEPNRFCGNCGTPLAAPANDLPDWLKDTEESPAPAASNDWQSEVGLPDESQDAQQPEQVPDWLAQLQHESEPGQPAPPQPADDLPDWLKDTPESAFIPAPPSTPATGATQPIPTASGELPDWLRDFSEPERIPAPGTPPVNRAATSSDDIPGWLKEFDTPAPVPATPAPPSAPATGATQPIPTTSGELPSWLRDVEADESAPATGATQPISANAGQLPAWLSDAPREPLSEAELLAADEPAEARVPEPQSADQSLPPWLAAEDTQPVAPDLPVPDWSSEFGVEDEPTRAEATSDLPDWLRDTDVETSAPPAASSGGSLSWLDEPDETPAPVPQPAAPARSWLDDLDADQRSSSAAPPSANPTDQLPPWLADQADQAQAGIAPQASDDLPPWLRDDQIDQPPTSAPAASNDLPPWLAMDDEPALSPPAASVSGDAPAWMADQQPSSDTASSELPPWLAADPLDQPQSSAQNSADELPSWLQPADEPAPVAEQGSVPAWLALPDQAIDQPIDDEAMDDARAEANRPAWLDQQDDEPSTPAYDVGDMQAVEPSQPGTVAQLPTWLDETPPATTETAQQSNAQLPSWLDDLPDEPAAPQQASAASTLPTWLDGGETPEPAPRAASGTAGQSELLGGVDLPAWLRDETEEPATPLAAAETAPAWLQHVTPEVDEPTAPIAATAVTPTRVARSDDRVKSMELLDRLLSEPAPEPGRRPEPKGNRWLWPVILLIVAAVLVGTLLWFLMNGRLGLSFGAVAPPDPGVTAVIRTIDSLPANRPVVLAYEWDAQRQGDIGPLESAVVSQLVGRTDVPLVFVSTDPQGTLLATERVDWTMQLTDNFHDKYALGVINAGYKPGGAIALRRLAEGTGISGLLESDAYGYDLRSNQISVQALCGTATIDGCAWSNVGLLIVMADEAEDVRSWFEQVRSAHPDLQTLLVTTAELGPQIQPYTALPNVRSISGLADAESYLGARGIDTEHIGRQRDATAIGGAIFALLVAVGAAPAYVTGQRARQQGAPDVWDR